MFIVEEPIKFSDEIQELMNRNAGIVREETKLKIGLKRILELKNEFYSRDNTVSVINGSSNKKNDIPVGKNPYDIEVNPSTNKIYVANHDDGTVSVINGKNNTKIGKDIPVGKGPSYIAINPSTNKIYVTNSLSNTVSVIDGYKNNRIYDIRVGFDPTVMSINSDMNIIYVVNSGSNTVSVVDGSADKVAAGITFNIKPAWRYLVS